MAVTQIKFLSDSLEGGRQTTFGDQTNNVIGPLADLNKSDFDYKLFKYPIASSFENSPDKAHEIIFYINTPQNSSWNTGPQNGPAPLANRVGNASNFGLRVDGGDNSGTILTGSDTTLASPTAFILSRKSVRTTNAISLYIPQTMVWSQNMQYDNVSLTDALGVLGTASSGLYAAAKGQVGAAGASLLSIAPSIANFFGLSSIGDALKGVNQVGMAALGIADNPQNFLLFKQIDFRRFQFDFLLTPENTDEAQIIEEIIYLFRFNSVPEVQKDTLGRYFIPPSDFDIDILHNGQRNLHIPQINTCVLNSIAVDYCASGQWGSHYDGTPLQTRMTLDFTETSILTKSLIQAGF
jgi:hypothetical protein